MFFHNKSLDLHLTTMTVKQVAALHAPLKREDTKVKTTEQQVMNKFHVKYTYMQRLILYVSEYRINIKTLKDQTAQFVWYLFVICCLVRIQPKDLLGQMLRVIANSGWQGNWAKKVWIKNNSETSSLGWIRLCFVIVVDMTG